MSREHTILSGESQNLPHNFSNLHFTLELNKKRIEFSRDLIIHYNDQSILKIVWFSIFYFTECNRLAIKMEFSV